MQCNNSKMSFTIATLVFLSLICTRAYGQDCTDNLVQALQKCANSISTGESLADQQEKCAPNGCNYDCPSSNRLDGLEDQFQEMSVIVGSLQQTVADNTESIATGTIIVQNIVDTQNYLQKTVANNSAEIDLIKEHLEHPCGSAGWTRVAYLDMTDPNQNCPSELLLYESDGKRACGRTSSSGGSCNSVFFPPNDTSYSEVCGRVYAYQKGRTQAIKDAWRGLESFYVDGVSITYGSPRNHIWTFMASFKDHGQGAWECPCQINAYFGNVASFISDNYFCESGVNTGQDPGASVYYFDDPLWDGEQCYNKESPCCQIPGLPWFTKTLEASTTDDIELRVCGGDGTGHEDSPVISYEIYIK